MMFIAADLSGIQDFLFDVQETGGKQAASLRFRSFRIQLITQCVVGKLLRVAGLSRDRLLFCSAGKIAIDAGSLPPDRIQTLHEHTRSIEQWLLEHTQGRLRLSFTIHDDGEPGDFATGYRTTMAALQRTKLQSWAFASGDQGTFSNQNLIIDQLWNHHQEATRDAHWGDRLRNESHKWVVINDSAHKNGGADEIVGLTVRLDSNEPTSNQQNLVHYESLDRLARHIPRDTDNRVIEFADLADQYTRGAPYLGVLRADADSLGQAVNRHLQSAEKLQRFSQRLEKFFASDLDQQLKSNSCWSYIYTVFSGGDDLFLVGPWDIVLDFTDHLQQQFTAEFKSDNLTISAGVAIIKARFPIRLAAQQAEQLLERAKHIPAVNAEVSRKQCAALGGLWKWKHHEKITHDGKKLADWVDAGIIERGWLHTLLELALIRRGEKRQPAHDPHPAMATARLAYHIARNWPKITTHPDNDKKRLGNEAREWIDIVLNDFDRPLTETRGRVRYLPSILRYALLATRSGDTGD